MAIEGKKIPFHLPSHFLHLKQVKGDTFSLGNPSWSKQISKFDRLIKQITLLLRNVGVNKTGLFLMTYVSEAKRENKIIINPSVMTCLSCLASGQHISLRQV
jgi:hypothetical protein